VALSGDRVVISGNKLSVYDSSHQNGYNPSTGYDPNVNTVGNVSLTVPVGYVYVLGDNRSDSLDSRTFGPLAKSAVIGTVVPGS
jgi:signal peptidase I